MRYYAISIILHIVRSVINIASSGSIGHYSKNRSDRSGAQIHDDLMAYSYCWKNNKEYHGSVGTAFLAEKIALCKLLNLPSPKKYGIPNLRADQYRENTYDLRASTIFSTDFLNHIRAQLPPNLQIKEPKIVVHIRRGDVNKRDYPHRYIDIDIYANLISNLVLQHPIREVTVHTESSGSEDIIENLGPKCKVMLDAPLEDVWKDIITSSVCVIAKSSFSYVPALFSSGLVMYFPFWHDPPEGWHPISIDTNDMTEPADAGLS